MKRVGEWILRVLADAADVDLAERVRREIREFTQSFPVPGTE